MPVPEQTSESAVAFLEWWFVVLNSAELVGGTDLLRANSSTECVFCNGQIENIDSIYQGGGRIERSGDSMLTNLNPTPVDLNGNVVVDFQGSTPAYRVLGADGTLVRDAAATPIRTYNAAIEWVNSRWQLRALAEQS